MPLPTPKQVRDLLEAQLGRGVAVGPAEPLVPTASNLTFAIYVDPHLGTQAVAVADLPAAARLGAAAGLVPIGVAEAALAEHGLPALLANRFHGVLSGWTGLFQRDGETALELYQAVLPDERPPADVLSLTAAVGQRLDLTVDVRSYGAGRLSLVLAR